MTNDERLSTTKRDVKKEYKKKFAVGNLESHHFN